MATSMLERPVRAGVFKELQAAERAVDGLRRAGFSQQQITVLCADREIEKQFEQYEHQEPAGHYAPRAVAGGALIGVAAGVLVTILAGALFGTEAVFVTLGIAIGAGAVVGAFGGAMMTQGVEKELANFYDQAVVSDGILVAAEDHGDHSVELLASAEQVLKEAGTRPIELSDG